MIRLVLPVRGKSRSAQDGTWTSWRAPFSCLSSSDLGPTRAFRLVPLNCRAPCERLLDRVVMPVVLAVARLCQVPRAAVGRGASAGKTELATAGR